ncbi:MAG: DUF4406 domain-containing protein [Plesiomonas sp.]|uniref:DUF4406 domain-containing protein n=1 Tax=Plesiomonas sp. TaxID=2486279 RepID=UPI003F2C1CE0
MKKIYIAGPMTGITELNRPAFNRYALDVKKSGSIPLNPAVLPEGLKHEEYMEICYPMVKFSDEVHLLPGWKASKGAKIEFAWAKELGKRIVYVQELKGGETMQVVMDGFRNETVNNVTESQLFTIEALNRIEGFVWPEDAKFASMDDGDRGVDFWSSRPELDIDECTYTQGGLQQANSIHSKHPDWRGSLISKAQFDSVDGWVRNDGNEPAITGNFDLLISDGEVIDFSGVSVDGWDWSVPCDDGFPITHWRYHKLSGLEINKKDSIPTLTDEQCLKFLSVAFRHCEIKGNVTFDDIRLGLKMALEKGHE